MHFVEVIRILGLTLMSAWLLNPVIKFAGRDSAAPKKEAPRRYKIFASATVLGPLVAALWAHERGDFAFASSCMMIHLGALSACFVADPTHLTRGPAEPFRKYASRFVLERIREMVRPKIAIIVAALSLPFLVDESLGSLWPFAGMFASLGFIYAKGMRMWIRIRPSIPIDQVHAHEKSSLDELAKVSSWAFLLAGLPCLYLIQNGIAPPDASALTGYSLVTVLVMIGSLLVEFVKSKIS